MDKVCKKLGVAAACAGKGSVLPWTPARDFAEWSCESRALAQELGIDEESALWLLRRHGMRVADVFDVVRETPQYASRIVSAVPLIFADLLLCARNEMAVHLSDLWCRRMPLLILDKLDADQLRHIAEQLAPVLHWDAQRIADEVAACLS